MRMARRILTSAVMTAMIAVVGCADPNREKQVDTQQQEMLRLTRERDEALARARQAMADRDRARQEAEALRGQLDDMRNQMAQGEGTRRGEFTDFGAFAYAEIPEQILFDSGKADLKQSGREKLQRIVAQIQKDYPDRNILVIGHTDTDPIRVTKGKWDDNLDLSLHRGGVVARELMRLGVTRTQVIAGGQGEYNPKSANDTKANKQLNRRVEIVAVQFPDMSEAGAAAPAGGSNSE